MEKVHKQLSRLEHRKLRARSFADAKFPEGCTCDEIEGYELTDNYEICNWCNAYHEEMSMRRAL